MNNLDEQLTTTLQRRAEQVAVRDDLNDILDGTDTIRLTDAAGPPRRGTQLLLLVAAAGIVAVTGGLVWAQNVRNEPASTAQQPGQAAPPDDPAPLPEVDLADFAPWALPPSPNPDRIDSYPIIDDLPDFAYANFSTRSDSNVWSGAIGALQSNGVPLPLVAVTAFGDGQDPFPDAPPGRIDGVAEMPLGEGRATLSWSIDAVPITLTGADLDTMYSLVEHVMPSVDRADRGGYLIVGELPAGLSELEAPVEQGTMGLPSISSESGDIAVSIEDGPFLSAIAATGVVDREPITINGLDGFISRGDRPLIALALSGDEVMFVSSITMTSDELIDFASTIRIGDEAEFRATYEVTD